MIRRTIWCDECGEQFSSEQDASAHESCMPQLKEGDLIEFEYGLLTETGKFQRFGPRVGPGGTRVAYVESDRVLEEPVTPFHTGHDYFVPAKDVKKREVAAGAT